MLAAQIKAETIHEDFIGSCRGHLPPDLRLPAQDSARFIE
jgi:hypothetical protein